MPVVSDGGARHHDITVARPQGREELIPSYRNDSDLHGQQPGFEGLVDDFLQLVGVFLNGAAWPVFKEVATRAIDGQDAHGAALDHSVEITKLWHDTEAFQATRAGASAARKGIVGLSLIGRGIDARQKVVLW